MSHKKITYLDSQQGYDQYAQFYDKKLDYLNSFEQNKLLPMMDKVHGKKIIDIGAGTGRLTTKLAGLGARVTALDISEKILKILGKKNNAIELVAGDAENLPFPDSSFDMAVGAFLIVHLKNLDIFFQEANRVLKPNGQLFITNINQKKPPELKTGNGFITIESYYHRPEKVLSSMEQAGFKIKKNIFIEENKIWINQIIVGEK